MSEVQKPVFLTEGEVVARYRGAVTPQTLRNWRSARRGPAFVKVGKAVLYPVARLETWEDHHLVLCAEPSEGAPKAGPRKP